MSKVILQGYIVVSDSDLKAVKAELPNHIRLTRAEAGCIVFNVVQDSQTPNLFDVYEKFADQAAFEQHQTRVKGSYWGQVASNVERHYSITMSEADS